MRAHLNSVLAVLAPAVLLSACASLAPATASSPVPSRPGVPAVTPSWRRSTPGTQASVPSRASTPPAAGGSRTPGIPTVATPSPSALPPYDDSGTARLLVLPASAQATSRLIIAHLAIRGRGSKQGYARSQFGIAWSDDVDGVTWGHNGCGTRDDILGRDLDAITRRGRCVVTGGTFMDPYTATIQHFVKTSASRWPIDHLVPLSYAWQMGANSWPEARRASFANDPLNLIATQEVVNSAKSDSAPASWLPPNTAIRCAYVTRFAEVALKYSLPVTGADRDLMLRQCTR